MPEKKLIKRFIQIIENVYMGNTENDDEFYLVSFNSNKGKIDQQSFTIAHHYAEFYNDGDKVEASKKTYGTLGAYEMSIKAKQVMKEFKQFYKSK